MSSLWRVRDGDPGKKGTSMVRLSVSEGGPDLDALRPLGLGRTHSYVQVRANGRTVGAILETIQNGTRQMVLDPLLRFDLGITEGTEVEVLPLEPVPASSVEVEVPPSLIATAEAKKLCRTYLEGQPMAQGQSKEIFLYSGKRVYVKIGNVIPTDLCILTGNTYITLISKPDADEHISMKDVGGLDREIRFIRERILAPLRNKELFSDMGISMPRGILLTGPPGCGKTLLAKAVAGELGIPCIEVRGPEVFAGMVGESEKRIRDIFGEARLKKPCLIIIDELEALALSRRNSAGELERRITTSLLAEMDGLRQTDDVIVIGTSNEANSIDSALRRPGRFDFELLIGAPDEKARTRILEIHTRHMPLNGVSLEDLSTMTRGFSGADLMHLCREAGFHAVRKVMSEREAPSSPMISGERPWITQSDFEEAAKELRPSALREFAVQVPGNPSWEAVGGLQQLKVSLVEEVVGSIVNPEAFARVGIRPVRGVLLYGPPGTGKTLLARIMANQAAANFIAVKGPEVMSKWVGQSEEKIREIFRKANEVSPCLIFFDEIDAITAARGQDSSKVSDRIVNQLLTEMDGIQPNNRVCVIAATNRKDLLDPALLRPGRFDYLFEVPLPEREARIEIFKVHLRLKPLADDINLEDLADDSKTRGFSGAHLEEVCRRATLAAFRETSFNTARTKVTQSHLLEACRLVSWHIEEVEHQIKPIGF